MEESLRKQEEKEKGKALKGTKRPQGRKGGSVNLTKTVGGGDGAGPALEKNKIREKTKN